MCHAVPCIPLFVCLQIPTTIADNAGYDSADLVSQLRAAHNDNKDTYGLGRLLLILSLSSLMGC